MRLEQQIGCDRCVHLFGRKVGEPWLRVLANVGVGPTVESTLLHPDQKVWNETVAETIALLDDCPQLASIRMEGESGGVTSARSEGCLIAAVFVEALDGSLRLGLNADVTGRAHSDEQRPGLGIDR